MSHNRNHQLTLRGLPADLVRELRTEARRLKTSVNQVVLRRILPPRVKKKVGAGADLLSLAGSWSHAQSEDFEKQLEGHRRIDPELWS